METVSSAAVVAGLATASPAVIATDADGTLWTGDVGEDWLTALEGGEARVNLDHLRDLTTRAGLGQVSSTSEVVRVARAAYEDGSLDEVTYFDLVALSFGGVDDRVARAAVRDALVAANLAARLVPETRAVLRGARAAHHRVVVVSASPRLVVEEALSLAGVIVEHVIGIEPMEGHLRTRTPRPYGAGKASHLDAFRGAANVHVALGDSGFDAAMLARAATPLAVRPKQSLVAIAAEVPGLRLLVA
jgi:phosphoserine phosphatase